MKLLNRSLIYLSVSLFFIVGIWSLAFYFNILEEIKKSVDEGLDNYKRQIVYKAGKDPAILKKSDFEGGFFVIREITLSQALLIKDSYTDSLMYMQDADDESPELEPVRLLTTAFENDGHYYELRIINSMVEQNDLAKELFRDVLVLYLILIGSLILINNLVLQRLWKPFYTFLNQLKDYKVGHGKGFPNARTKTKEFNDLQSAVHILLQSNVETYERQKQFIGNASHELQTPLAIARNKLELLIEKGTLQSDQAGDIAEIMDIIERLTRLNKSLLLLTKIENKQFLHNESVLLNDIIRQSLDDLEEIAEFKHIEIHFLEKAEVQVQMEVSLAGVLISNLLRNAVFHNVSGGKVEIEVTEKEIAIGNTDNKVPVDEEKIFSRFYKSKHNPNGTGLGLAIVKAICDLYHFDISHQSKNGWHFFRLRFK